MQKPSSQTQFLRNTELEVLAVLALESLRNFDEYLQIITHTTQQEHLLDKPHLFARLPELARKMATPSAIAEAKERIERWRAEAYGLLALGTDCYPESLTTIADPPPLLFARGNLGCLNPELPRFTIVGARKATIESCKIASRFASDLASSMCIVSGLALGIDGAAHKGALHASSNAPTIAVLGNGLSKIYPRTHMKLAEQLLNQGGLLLSQFPPETPPYPANFLNRNRVVAGLSDAGLIVQAGARSGSLNTARHLLEQGKEVFVVPGSIRNGGFEGSHSLIQQGAVLSTSAEEILEYLDFEPEQEGQELAQREHYNEHPIIKALSSGAKSTAELEVICESLDLWEQLLLLELEGLIEPLGGNRFTLAL